VSYPVLTSRLTSDASGRFLPYWNRGTGEIKREVSTGYDTEADGVQRA
jgi:methyl-accepting chemotaxis protein